MRRVAMALLVTALLAAGCGAGPAVVRDPGPAASQNTASPAPAGSRTEQTYAAGGVSVTYTLLLPDAYRPGAELPILLALPPGGQGKAEVDAVLDAYWEAGAREHGWIVVSPVAPPSGLYVEPGSAALLPGLLAAVAATYPPEGGRFHLAGVSNGGLSAFRVALDHPELFSSLLTIPGNPPEASDYDHLDELVGIPVELVVGADDNGWREASERTVARITELGGTATLIVSAGDGHIVRNVATAALWDFLDSTR